MDLQLCFCSICRKVGGSGGSINLGGHSDSLKVEGKENIRWVSGGCSSASILLMACINILYSVYRAILDRGTPQERQVSSERSFCKKCSSMLWLYDKQWFLTLHNLFDYSFIQSLSQAWVDSPLRVVSWFSWAQISPDDGMVLDSHCKRFLQYRYFRSVSNWTRSLAMCAFLKAINGFTKTMVLILWRIGIKRMCRKNFLLEKIYDQQLLKGLLHTHEE